MITTTPFAARDPYIAVAAASFNIVKLSIRVGSKSYIFSMLTSKPSIIKVGRFGLFSRFERDRSLSKSLIPNPERPRIYISGTVFGSEPN